MRHGKHGRTLGRKSPHRKAMWSNMVASLIEFERIQTTDAKAKEVRRIAERTINWSASLGDILTRDREKLDADDRARLVHAMRMAGRVVKKREVLERLFSVVGPRFIGRPGGYTRVMKAGFRYGDSAPVAVIEFVDRDTEAKGKDSGPVEATTQS